MEQSQSRGWTFICPAHWMVLNMRNNQQLIVFQVDVLVDKDDGVTLPPIICEGGCTKPVSLHRSYPQLFRDLQQSFGEPPSFIPSMSYDEGIVQVHLEGTGK
jgi:hypothetical protein